LFSVGRIIIILIIIINVGTKKARSNDPKARRSKNVVVSFL